jgi:stage II sporulation protein M
MKQKRKRVAPKEVNIFSFIKESRKYFYIILAIFILSLLIGYFFPFFGTDYILNLIKNLADKTSGMSFLQLLLYIIKNNITTAFTGMILGILFGIFPLFVTIFNGYVLGFVMSKAAFISGWSVIFKLVPHGIFEIPALVISLGLGLRIGLAIFSRKENGFSYVLFNSLKTFLFIIVPLLLIAGVIETLLIFFLG